MKALAQSVVSDLALPYRVQNVLEPQHPAGMWGISFFDPTAPAAQHVFQITIGPVDEQPRSHQGGTRRATVEASIALTVSADMAVSNRLTLNIYSIAASLALAVLLFVVGTAFRFVEQLLRAAGVFLGILYVSAGGSYFATSAAHRQCANNWRTTLPYPYYHDAALSLL
jgi:hypothetical protein